MQTFRWGILAPGHIAEKFAEAITAIPDAAVTAVGSRDRGRAEAFAARHAILRAYGSYADLVADPDLDAIYVASPHSHHRDHVLLALAAGKPVLCARSRSARRWPMHPP